MLYDYPIKSICKELADLGIGQFPLVIGTVYGIKPLFDTWIPIQAYNKLKIACKNYDLFCQPDCMFVEPTKKELATSIGAIFLTTTKFKGLPFDPNLKEGMVHVFISKYRKSIFNAHRFGWYPLIIRKRVIDKPFIDHLRFGEVLGYPDCCIEFFNSFNKFGMSTPYESYKKTKGTLSYYCNNILNHIGYSYIHHHPCSFNCKKTIDLAKQTEEVILEKEPDYAHEIRKALKLPIINFAEKISYVFEGKIKNGYLYYSKFKFIGHPRDDKYRIMFCQGNRIKVKDDEIIIYNDNKLVQTIKKKRPFDGFLLEFD